MTRRGFLALLAASASACDRSGRPPLRGRIVGADHGRGHRLREGPPSPPPPPDERTGVAVVGAGIAGLSAAWALEHAGYGDFLVLDLDDHAGGTARAGSGPIGPYPWGAHYVTAPPADQHAMVALLAEVGAVAGRDSAGRPLWAEDVLCREPVERLHFRGEWHEGLYPRAGASRRDLTELESFEAEVRRWAATRDDRGQRLFRTPRRLCADAPAARALDRRTLASFLDDLDLGSQRLRWYVEYACRDDFGTTLEQTSAWAGLHYFAARLEGPDEPPAPFLTWPEGNGRLVRHLAEMCGPRLRLGSPAVDVRAPATGVEITYFDVHQRRLRTLAAEAAIVAVPRFVARRVVASLRQESAPALPYGAWVVANLTLAERPRERTFPLAWDNVRYDSPALGYVVATHQSGVDHGPSVWTHYLALTDDDPRAARASLLETPWRALADAVLADLSPAHPELPELVSSIDVQLWGHAMVQPRPGVVWSDGLSQAARPRGRVFFAHTDLSGMALFEEGHDRGVQAAEASLAALGQPFQPWSGGGR